MRKGSSHSVRITYFPKERVREALANYVPDIVSKHPEIKRIVLFGSVARGDAVPGSDVDLLLVLSSSPRPFLERMTEFQPERFPVGVETFAYTEEELEKMHAEGNWFIRRALKEGEVLFDRETV